MILKARVHAPVHGADDGWVYLDGIRRIENYGLLPPAEPSPPGQPEEIFGRFRSHEEIFTAVERMWGPLDVRQFAHELWPEMPTDREATTATVVHCGHDDERLSLAILVYDAFLMSDDGKTIERLR